MLGAWALSAVIWGGPILQFPVLRGYLARPEAIGFVGVVVFTSMWWRVASRSSIVSFAWVLILSGECVAAFAVLKLNGLMALVSCSLVVISVLGVLETFVSMGRPRVSL
jgi:hypothetical protein